MTLDGMRKWAATAKPGWTLPLDRDQIFRLLNVVEAASGLTVEQDGDEIHYVHGVDFLPKLAAALAGLKKLS